MYKTHAERWNETAEILPETIHECQWEVGDKVRFTNAIGIQFGPYQVVGFTTQENELHGNFIYIDWECPWFPCNPGELTVWE